MGLPSKSKANTIKNALELYPMVQTTSLARLVLTQNPGVFASLEDARTMIRYYRGKCGIAHLNELSDRSFIAEIPKQWGMKREPYVLTPGLWLIAACLHIPYHEQKPIESMIKHAKEEGVMGILFNGDFQDCYSVSKWFRERNDINAEIEATIKFLEFFRYEFPDVKMVWKPGNHEYRLPMHYMRYDPSIAGSLLGFAAMESVLDLDGKNIEYLDYLQIVMAGKLPILHGHEFKLGTTVNPARGLFLKAKTWALCSHHHRTSQHSGRNLKGELLTTWSTGCLCDLSPDYMPYNDWNWGFAMVNIEKNGQFEVTNWRILPNGKVVP